jgi:hypothetical protein
MALSHTAISNNKVDQLLSQSDWASPDDIPSVLFADNDLDHPHQPPPTNPTYITVVVPKPTAVTAVNLLFNVLHVHLHDTFPVHFQQQIPHPHLVARLHRLYGGPPNVTDIIEKSKSNIDKNPSD